MGYRWRKWPVVEVAVLTVNRPDIPASERACVGDIIAVRNPHYVIGTKETKDYIWLRIEGLEETDLWKLDGPAFDDKTLYLGWFEEKRKRYEKRRYCIPLRTLKEYFPDFDIDRAKNPNDIYQPFMILDEDNLTYLAPRKPFRVEGLVFDKVTGNYL